MKAQSIVAELRKYSFALDEKEKVRRSLLDAKKIDKKQAFDQAMADLQVVSNAFDSNLASDTYNVENELRKRMDPAAIAHIPRVPALVFPGGTRVTFPALMRNSGLDADFIRPLTDEIEQMADLLPPDSAKH